MNKKNMLILILVILSIITSTGYSLAVDRNVNISTNVTGDEQASRAVDTISINENASVINITENSNETTVVETIIKEEQTKSSPGFSSIDTVISLIISIILLMGTFSTRKNR